MPTQASFARAEVDRYYVLLHLPGTRAELCARSGVERPERISQALRELRGGGLAFNPAPSKRGSCWQITDRGRLVLSEYREPPARAIRMTPTERLAALESEARAVGQRIQSLPWYAPRINAWGELARTYGVNPE